MRVIEVNQIGVFLGMRAAIPAMLPNRRGSIVNISSTSGLHGLAGAVAYTASKFAVRGMTKNAALEYGKAGIRVNSDPSGCSSTRPWPSRSSPRIPVDHARFPIPRPGRPERWPTWPCSWPPTNRASAPAPSTWSTAARWRGW